MPWVLTSCPYGTKQIKYVMTKKTISFVQPNFQQGPKEFNAYYLPYSAGVVWSYSLADPAISERFEATDWIWRRDALEPTAQRLALNSIVTFSTYVWNHRYNYELARRIKEINPTVLTVFGGPEPAITDPDLFRKEPFMDLVICYEGEITFKTDFIRIVRIICISSCEYTILNSESNWT